MTNKNIFVACDVSSQKEIIKLLELIPEDNRRIHEYDYSLENGLVRVIKQF